VNRGAASFPASKMVCRAQFYCELSYKSTSKSRHWRKKSSALVYNRYFWLLKVMEMALMEKGSIFSSSYSRGLEKIVTVLTVKEPFWLACCLE
jgi:hypothetical protein